MLKPATTSPRTGISFPDTRPFPRRCLRIQDPIAGPLPYLRIAVFAWGMAIGFAEILPGHSIA